MAGPAIRAFEMAINLLTVANVKLVSTVEADLQHPALPIAFVNSRSLKAKVRWADIVVFQGALLSEEPWISRSRKILVSDLYDPIHLEALEQQKSLPRVNRFVRGLQVGSIMNRQVLRADYFLCASSKQRDFWLGQLASLGRLNPANYERDESLRSLIDVAPFGIQSEPPVQTEHLIKGVIPGISTSDKVILWGGGVYNWFDPLTLIRAMKVLSERHRDLRLVFLGTKHPNPQVPAMRMLVEAKRLAEELDLIDSAVFFNSGWVPYSERANALLDADVGISTHLDHLETAFSFRTRILDYIWAGLPIIATRGDIFEPLIEANELGLLVSPGDVEELASAIEKLVYEKGLHHATSLKVKEFANNLHWDKALAPLLSFVSNPRHAADYGSNFSSALGKLDRLRGGRLRQRLFLYRTSAREFGLTATVRSVSKNFANRFVKSDR